jgi:hypothetical protein
MPWDGAPTLCFVIGCMGRLAHLKESLASAATQPGCSCVVVDYSCPDHCGDWVEATFPRIRVVRVPGKTRYNQCIARNAGGKVADAEWLCFRDADVILAPSFSQEVIPLLRQGAYYSAAPLDDPALYGTFVCSRRDYLQIGGYDEVYEGWGDADLDLYASLANSGIKEERFPSTLLRHIPHDAAMRTRFYESRQTVSWTINRLYRVAKFEVMRLTGAPIRWEDRLALYQAVAGTIKEMKPEDRQRVVTINLGPIRIPFPDGATLERTLVLTYKLPG